MPRQHEKKKEEVPIPLPTDPSVPMKRTPLPPPPTQPHPPGAHAPGRAHGRASREQHKGPRPDATNCTSATWWPDTPHVRRRTGSRGSRRQGRPHTASCIRFRTVSRNADVGIATLQECRLRHLSRLGDAFVCREKSGIRAISPRCRYTKYANAQSMMSSLLVRSATGPETAQHTQRPCPPCGTRPCGARHAWRCSSPLPLPGPW